MEKKPLIHRQLGPAVEQMYQFLRWLIPAVERFPRSQKFLLGDRIQTTALDVQECLLEATYTKARTRPLNGANMGLEKLRMFFRLAYDLHYLDMRRYEYAARSLDEVGRLIGGWIRQERARPSTSEAAGQT